MVALSLPMYNTLITVTKLALFLAAFAVASCLSSS